MNTKTYSREILKDWINENLIVNNKINGQLVKPKNKLMSNNPNIYNELINYSKRFNTENLIEVCYIIVHNLNEKKKCHCGNHVKFAGFIKGYLSCCSGKCVAKIRKPFNENIKHVSKNNTNIISNMNNNELIIWIKENLFNTNNSIDSSKLRKDYNFYNDNKEIFNLIDNITSWMDSKESYNKRLYSILNNLNKYPKCTECNNKVKRWDYENNNFKSTCCDKCAWSKDERQEKGKLTKIKNYGENFQELIFDKIRKTNLERYGVINPILNSDINNKKQETLFNKYGVINPSQIEGVKIKKQETFNKKSDTEKEALYNKIISKARQTKIERGLVIPREEKEDLTHYRELISLYTNRNFRKYYYFINPKRLKRGINDYHIDHIYSVFEAFKNNIPIWIICHPCNLRMLESNLNRSKGKDIHHSLEELLDKIEKFEKERI